MTLDKYTPFQTKKNAAYHGDPNGSYIMAEDINLIQDSVNQLEKAIGLNSIDLSLTERIDRISSNAALRADKFIVYRGNPLLAYETLEEAIHSFSFVEHLVLEKQSDGGFDSFLNEIRTARTKLYGYIDCTSTQSLSVIQLNMEWWKSQGATGVFLANFDYDSGNTRTRQNDILLAAQERGLRAIVTGSLNYVLFNAEHMQNPDWTPLSLTSKDGYYLTNAFVQSGVRKGYDESLALAKDIIRAKETLGISIYIEDTANGSAIATQGLYEHGHSLALLFGMDGYFVNRTDFYQLNDPIRYHAWAPFLGAWSDGNITLVETVSDVRRRTSFGEIIYAKSSNTVIFTGLTIPPELMQWKANSIPGAAIVDGSIPDSKIEGYDGNRLITSINESPLDARISLAKLENALLQDMDGYITIDALKANVIEAINARIENLEVVNAKIDSAIIGTLEAEHITASVIEAINISTGHLEAGSAYIHGAVIDQLDAGSIRSGDIDTDRLNAHVIEAINLNAGHATIESAVIGELQADRIQAEVVKAINLYAQSAVIDKAVIDSAVIGTLKASHIEAEVIKAINANIGHAYIDKAVIPILDAGHISASVIDALEANIGSATIDKALIGQLDATHIQSSVIAAINANINLAKIDKAIIPELEAGHISASVIDALEANIGTATINKALIPELDAGHIKANVIDAINLSAVTAVIEGAKIKEATIDAAHIVKGSITSAEIADATIKAANIELGSITSAIIGEGQVDTINIAQGAITDALIKNLSADKINAGTINSSLVKIQGDNGHLTLSGNRLQVFADNAVIDPVTGTPSLVRYERVSIGDVNNDGTAYGFRVRGADGTTVLYDEKGVYNEGITDGAITNPKIDDDAIDDRVIKAGSIFTKHLVADQILADHIATGAVNAKHILAGSITAGSAIIADGAIGKAQMGEASVGTAQIENASITNAHIKDLNADKITAGKVKAQFIEIGGDTTFLTGYNPSTINANLRSDLRLNSALPSNITLSSSGIKVTTTADPNQYVVLDHRGLYVHNGALIIEGGLNKDHIDPDTAAEWDKASQFVDDMTSDDIVTASEKILLKRDWDGWVIENNSLMAMATYYWPDNTTAPFEKTDYVTKYGELREYLTALPDGNNLMPILHPSNMLRESQVDGGVLNQKINDFKTGKFRLTEKLSITAKELADAAQDNVDEVENNIVYKVEITSSRGNIFKNGQIDTVLEAHAYHGSQEVTDQFDASRFRWTRVSSDSAGDLAWNQNHFSGMKTITITPADVYVRATFNCELLE